MLVGPCIGGPYKGRKIACIETPHILSLMGQVPYGGRERWDEIKRGCYEYDSGCWWWRGWNDAGRR
jgi:hypothetical protein